MVRNVDLGEQTHAVKMLRGLKFQTTNDGHCDFIIKVCNMEYKAHKSILSVGSPYFEAMLKHDTKERREGKVEMHNVDFACVKSCIDFMYTGNFDIPDGKIGDLMHVAALMQLDDVKSAVCDVLDKSLYDSMDDFYETMNIAKLYGFPKLLSRCEAIYRNQFVMIAAYLPGFRDEPNTFLFNTLKCKKLKLSEEEKFTVSLKWAGNDSERLDDLVQMVKFINFKMVSSRYLNDLLDNHRVIRSERRLHDLVSAALADSAKRNRRHARQKIILFESELVSPRCYNPISNTITYSHKADSWPLASFTAVALDSHIYAVGGEDSAHRLYFPDKNSKWERLEFMSADHGFRPPAVLFHGSIFVIGSGDDYHYSVPTKDVEKFDPTSDEWLKLNDAPRNMCATTLVSLDDSIYCIGGLEDQHTIKTFTRFTPSNSEWVDLEPMLFEQRECGAVAVEQKILVVSGYDMNMQETECYDVTSGQWTRLSPMVEGISGCHAHYLNGWIYAVPRLGYLNEMEKYEVATDQWQKIKIHGRNNFKICASVMLHE